MNQEKYSQSREGANSADNTLEVYRKCSDDLTIRTGLTCLKLEEDFETYGATVELNRRSTCVLWKARLAHKVAGRNDQ